MKTKKSVEWIEKNYKMCEHCDKKNIDPQNYTRWHGDSCKKSPNYIEKQGCVCEHCNAGPMIKSNYIRWHGDKCKKQRMI